MSEVDLPLLQAKVIVQGLMIQALAAASREPTVVRIVFDDELRRLLPTLSPDIMGFVKITADHMFRQLPKPTGALQDIATPRV